MPGHDEGAYLRQVGAERDAVEMDLYTPPRRRITELSECAYKARSSRLQTHLVDVDGVKEPVEALHPLLVRPHHGVLDLATPIISDQIA